MRVEELFEGQFRGHGYDLGHYPTSRDRGLGALYNSVIPNLARIFKVPVANFKVQSDHGFDWHDGAPNRRPYSVEKCIMRIYLRKKGLDVDLIAKMFPKAVKAELSKWLTDVEVSEATVIAPEEHPTVGGPRPPRVEVRFTAKYPEEWIKWDKERYGIKWE